MRQIKNYLRSKRTMWNCQEPVCATLNAWKCMNELCGCGESNGGLQPGNKAYVSGNFPDVHIKLFATAPDGEDYIEINTGGFPFTTSGIFSSEGGDALVEILSSSYAATFRSSPFMLGTNGDTPTDGGIGTIKAEVVSLVKAVLNDPTEANKQSLINAIDASIDAIMEQGDASASFVTYDNAGTTITILEPQSSIPVGGEEQRIGTVAVIPSTETVTVTSSDPSLLTVRVEKIVDAPVNAYKVYGTGIAGGTVIVTITGVNDPTASASFSIDILE